MASSGLSVPLFTISSKVSVKHIPIVDLRYSSNVAILRHRTRSEPITQTHTHAYTHHERWKKKLELEIENWKWKPKMSKRCEWFEGRVKKLNEIWEVTDGFGGFGVELVILLLLRLVCTFGLRRNFERRDLGLFIP